MKNSLIGISVVIPTHNRSKLVRSLLNSLKEARNHYSGDIEILVIDDSQNSEKMSIQGSCNEFNAKFIPGMANVREKRNLGINRAIYPIVLFVDSDCEVMPDLLEQHARIYEESGTDVAAVVGVTEFIGDNNWMWDVVIRTQFLNAFSFANRMEYAPWATCSNTSYRHDVLSELGCFDTTFPLKLGADDTDLGLRINKANYRMKCNANAVVHHSRKTWSNFFAIWRRAFRWGRMDIHLYYRKHKDHMVNSAPRFSHIFLGLVFVSIINMIITTSLIYLVLPLFWGIISLGIQAMGTVILKKEKLLFIFHEFLADVLGLAFEFGTVFEGIYRHEITAFYKTAQRGPVLPIFIQQEGLLNRWSMWISVLLTMIFQSILR